MSCMAVQCRWFICTLDLKSQNWLSCHSPEMESGGKKFKIVFNHMSRLHANLFVTFINSHLKLFVLGCLSFCSFISTVRCSGPVECRSNPSQSTLHLQQHGATSFHRWFVSLIIPELQKCKFPFCFWQLWLLLGDHCYCCWLQSFGNFLTGPSSPPSCCWNAFQDKCNSAAQTVTSFTNVTADHFIKYGFF